MKDPSEVRGKSKNASIAAPEVVPEPSTVVDVSAIGIPHKEPEDNPISVVTIEPVSDDHAEELINLRTENENLRKEVKSIKYELYAERSLVHDAARDMVARRDLMDKLKTTLKQVHDMVENGCNHVDILSQIDWRISG